MDKYITVINRYTKVSVPFKILDNGEVQIISPNPFHNEDTCKVILGDIYYEHSQDYQVYYKRV